MQETNERNTGGFSVLQYNIQAEFKINLGYWFRRLERVSNCGEKSELQR